MFIMWSQQKYYGQFVICATNTLEEIKELFAIVCDDNDVILKLIKKKN